MLSLHFFCQFSSGCGVCKNIFIFISRTQSNLPTSLPTIQRKRRKKPLSRWKQKLLLWCGRPQNIGETVLRFWPAGHCVTIWDAGGIYERPHVIHNCLCLTCLFDVKVKILELWVGFVRSWWPRGLRRWTAAARLLVLRVRIPPGHGCVFLWVRPSDHQSRVVLRVWCSCVWSNATLTLYTYNE
jgi:hypothetical protein